MNNRDLSKNKKAFMQDSKNTGLEPHFMPAADIPVFSRHYRKKLNVSIIMNGASEYGQKLLQPFRNECKNILQSLDQYPLATYIAKSWMPELDDETDYFISDCNWKLQSEYKALIPIMAEYAKIIHVEDLSETEANDVLNSKPLESLNLPWLEQYCQLKLSKEQKDTLNRFSTMYRLALEKKLTQGLNKQEVMGEIKTLQTLLRSKNSDSFHAYIYTGKVLSSCNHFDTYLISKDTIIRTPYWNTYFYRGGELHLPGEYSADLSVFSLKRNEDKHNPLPHPQADQKSCGVFGIASSKELLKDNAYQLKHLTLRLRFYNPQGELQYFFLTSPYVLRYSQSSRYNETLKNLLMNKGTFFTSEDKQQDKNSQNMNTIEQALLDSIAIAKTLEDKDVSASIIKENEDILKKLPEFRKIWIAAYEEMSKKYPQMKSSINNLHLGLLYRGQKYKKIAMENKPVTLEKHANILSADFSKM